ncbi:MAG TPA: hypothetical protein VGL94_01535, partial [Ktedonobacteraceae bacterium]
MIDNLASKRLHSSIRWFAIMAAVLSLLFAGLMWMTGIYGSIQLAILEVPATILSSVLCWWLCIAHPKRVSILRGGLTSIVSGICGHVLFMMWLLMWPFLLMLYQNPAAAFPIFFGILIGLAVLIIPLGSC